jgi:DnaJ-class molecular chaperone
MTTIRKLASGKVAFVAPNGKVTRIVTAEPEPEPKPKPMPKHRCWDGCNGSGKFRAGRLENGRFVVHEGVCFRCQGKGYQTPADVKRNTYYDNNVRRIHA